jgi:hypothetical protein
MTSVWVASARQAHMPTISRRLWRHTALACILQRKHQELGDGWQVQL